MQPIFHGLENAEDMIFWKHYHAHLSTVLTVEGEHKNAFKDLLIPIATKHQGLMHSILALSMRTRPSAVKPVRATVSCKAGGRLLLVRTREGKADVIVQHSDLPHGTRVLELQHRLLLDA